MVVAPPCPLRLTPPKHHNKSPESMIDCPGRLPYGLVCCAEPLRGLPEWEWREMRE